MFTGIIEEVGKVKSLEFRGNVALIEIEATKVLEGLQRGESMAVNGVCLTVRVIGSGGFQSELSQETLTRTNLRYMELRSRVNLERPLSPTSRLGGHFVQGHVDGVGQVVAIDLEDGFAYYQFSFPSQIQPYIVEKGSIAVDGISLTIAALEKDSFKVAVVPHTLENTNLNTRYVGDWTNLECDILAKYVESLLKYRSDSKRESGLTVEYLRDRGY
jgi:riboflavin synthase